MVYKKYIKRKGKLYGPYYYKNVRDSSGKVKNIFLGSKKQKQNFIDKNISSIGAFSITFLILLVLLHHNYPGLINNGKQIQRSPNLNWDVATLPNETILLEDIPYFRDIDTTYSGSFSPIIYDTNALAPFSIDSSNGIISFTPNKDNVGDYSGNNAVSIIAKESTAFGEVIYFTWQFIIQEVNDAPTMTPLTYLPNASQYSPYYFEIDSSDEESNNITFFDDFPYFDIQTIGDKGVISFTPTPIQVGIYVVNITLCDNSTINPLSACTSQLLNFEILNNSPPNITRLPNLTGAIQGQEYYDFVNATDIDGDAFNYSIIITPLVLGNPLFVIQPISGIINFTPINDYYVGSFQATFIVTDINNAASSVTKTFIVNNINDPPNITSIIPNDTNVIIYENTINIFNFTANDPDDPILFYRWGLDNYINASYNNFKNFTFIPSFNEANQTTNNSRSLTLLVVDDDINQISGAYIGEGQLSANFTNWNSSLDYYIWNITILNTNRPPIQTATIPNQTWAQGSINQNLNLNDFFFDPDLDFLYFNYSFITNSTQISVLINPISHAVTLTPQTNYYGSEIITFIVSDTINTTISNEVNLTVYQANVTTPPPPVPVPVPVPVPTSSTTQTKIAALSVSVPSLLTAKPDTTITEVVTLTNTGEVDLNLISLKTQTSSTEISAVYDVPSIRLLAPGRSTQVNLIVTTSEVLTQESYTIDLLSDASNPKLSESNTIYLASVPTNLTRLEVEILFAIDLFEKNSECLELKELISQAKQKQIEGKSEEAETIIQNAVDSCTSILKQSRVRLPATQVSKPKFEFYLPVLAGLFTLLIVIIAILFVMYKRKK